MLGQLLQINIQVHISIGPPIYADTPATHLIMARSIASHHLPPQYPPTPTRPAARLAGPFSEAIFRWPKDPNPASQECGMGLISIVPTVGSLRDEECLSIPPLAPHRCCILTPRLETSPVLPTSRATAIGQPTCGFVSGTVRPQEKWRPGTRDHRAQDHAGRLQRAEVRGSPRRVFDRRTTKGHLR